MEFAISKRSWVIDRNKVVAADNECFGRPNKQNSAWGEQPPQHFERAVLGRRVEIDQDVPTKDDVVGRFIGKKIIAQQVPLFEADLLSYGGCEFVTPIS